MDDMGIDQPELDGFPPAESTNHLTTFVSAFGDWHDRLSHNMGLPVNTGNISRETIFLSMTNLYQRVAASEDMAFIFVLCFHRTTAHRNTTAHRQRAPRPCAPR